MYTLLSSRSQRLGLTALMLSCQSRSFIQSLSPTSTAAASATTAKNNSWYRVVQYESGQTEDALPIFTTTPEGVSRILDEGDDPTSSSGACYNSDATKQQCTAVTKTSSRPEPTIQHYPEGVFVIHNLLSQNECLRIMEISEEMGYTKDASFGLGRRNENCVWIMDEHINQVVFDRIKHFLPSRVEFQGHSVKGPLGLNQRWRLHKYNPGDVFKRHRDQPWPPAGIDPHNGTYIHDASNGKALSWMSFLIYLNDDFEGGSTKFPAIGKADFTPEGEPTYFEVQPTQGTALVFYHGYHAESKLHEGSLVTNGTKYVARTEVLYELHSWFRVVQCESGQTEDDLPIFTTTPEGASRILDPVTDEDDPTSSSNACYNSNATKQQCTTTTTKTSSRPEPTIQHYPEEVFVIHNLLSRNECQRIMEISEEMGYTEDAPVSLGRQIRRNENCVWIMDEHINQVVFDRIKHLLPPMVEFQGHSMKGPLGLNRRWRLYKYNPDDIFKRHTDGPWPPAGIDPQNGTYIHDTSNGKALTWMSFLIYLNDDFEGGSTKFPAIGKADFTPEGEPTYFEVQPTQGTVLVFYHGYHAESKLHEGSLVTNGTKYVARTEVLYELPPELSDLQG